MKKGKKKERFFLWKELGMKITINKQQIKKRKKKQKNDKRECHKSERKKES